MKTQESLHFSLHFGKKTKKTLNKTIAVAVGLKSSDTAVEPRPLVQHCNFGTNNNGRIK